MDAPRASFPHNEKRLRGRKYVVFSIWIISRIITMTTVKTTTMTRTSRTIAAFKSPLSTTTTMIIIWIPTGTYHQVLRVSDESLGQ